jgi:hypothetical protein
MNLTAEIVELDLFRRTRDALREMRRHVPREARLPQPVDWYLPGVLRKARVATAFGDIPIELLRPRDDVRTYSGKLARVEVVDKIHLDQDFLRRSVRALPIRIPTNSIAPGRPSDDLYVSPGQEISLDVHVATAFHGARTLSSRFRMDLSYATGLTYHRFHCGEPTVVMINGIWLRIDPWTEDH